MATVYFDEATRIYASGHAPAVDHVTLDIEDGEFLVLVGPSGCGKSTTLRMVAGLEPVNEGRILIDGHDQKSVRPRDRDVAMVFQSYALYPNMTAAENMGFALTNAKTAVDQLPKTRSQDYARVFVPGGGARIGKALDQVAQGADVAATFASLNAETQGVIDSQIKAKL